MSDQRLRLQQYLDSVPFGAITDTDTLIPLLKNAWPEFDGSESVRDEERQAHSY